MTRRRCKPCWRECPSRYLPNLLFITRASIIARERQNFFRLTSLIDQPTRTNAAGEEGREPQFFSQNVASLSKTLAGVKSQSIIAKRTGRVETQTVRYEWAQ